MRPALPLCAVLLLGACLSPITAIDSGPLSLDSPCQPYLEVDPCNAWGYVCDMVDAGFSCQYAEFDDPCLPSVGCDPDAGGLHCYEFANVGSPTPSPYCGTPCTVATDCPLSIATCSLAYLPDGGATGACAIDVGCSNAFGPCTVDPDAGVGTCFPIGDLGDLVCTQSGPLGTDSPCSGIPTDGGAYLCQPDDLCTSGPSGVDTACLAVCGGSLSCPGGTTCVQGLLSFVPLCVTPCDPSGSACPSPFICQEVLGSAGEYCTLP